MAAKKKSGGDSAGFTQFKRELSAGKLGQLYVFHGEESWLMSYYLRRVREELLGEGDPAFNFHSLSPAEMTPERLEECVDCLPVLSERTLILVRDYELFQVGEEERKRYAEIFSDLPEYCCLVFVYEAVPFKADARTKLYAAARAHGQVVEFARQSHSDLKTWVGRRFAKLGKEIEPRLAGELIDLCGDLMTVLDGEIEKIAAYARGPRITRADIDAVAIPQLDAVIFRMTDAIGDGNFDRAVGVLGDLYRMQEQPGGILAYLSRQMRQIYSARLCLERRLPTQELYQIWGFKKQFQLERLLRSAQRFSLEACRWMVLQCAETEIAIHASSGDEQMLLTQLLLRMAVGPEVERVSAKRA